MEMEGVLAEVIEAFEVLEDKRSRLEYLIELGETLEHDESIILEENRIPGCVSTVYMAGSVHDGLMQYSGWADSLIVRGFVRILCDALSGHEPKVILEESEPLIEEFVSRTGIDVSMIESRANTFANLYGRMRSIAEVHA